MNKSDLELLAKKFPISDATRRRNPAYGLPPSPEPQCLVQHEPVAKEEGKRADPVRHLVRIESYRLHLLDERNLADKYFTDTLIYAGLIHGDSTKEAQVIVEQFRVSEAALERTEITITLLP